MGSKTTETLIESFLMIATKAVDMLVKIKDVDALQKEVNTTTSLLKSFVTLLAVWH